MKIVLGENIFLNRIFLPSLKTIDKERHTNPKIAKYYKKHICRCCRGIIKRNGDNLTKAEKGHVKNKYMEFLKTLEKNNEN